MKIYHAELTDAEAAASARGRRSIRKGKDFEREVVRLLRETLPACYAVQRMIQARGGGGLPDVEIRLNDDPLIHAECKHGICPNIRNALEQARRDARAGAVPVAITRADREEILATMLLDDLVRLLKGMGGRDAKVE